MNTDFDFSCLPTSTITGKPVLHFAHANGMPSLCYQPMFDVLQAYFTIEYIPLLGATDGYPVDQHWHSLTKQVIDSVSNACSKHNVSSVVALGHSLGSLCTLQALYKRPELFSTAVLCDPPLIYGWYNFVMHISKQLDKLPKVDHFFLDKLSPSGISRHRKDTWGSREEAGNSFKNKKFFADFHPQCLQGYIDHGLKDTHDGNVTLAIPKNAEVAVFRSNPSWWWLTPNKPPHVPVTTVIGQDSIFLQKKFPQMIKKRLNVPYVVHKGGHMFPLEHPESVAQTVLELYQQSLIKR